MLLGAQRFGHLDGFGGVADVVALLALRRTDGRAPEVMRDTARPAAPPCAPSRRNPKNDSRAPFVCRVMNDAGVGPVKLELVADDRARAFVALAEAELSSLYRLASLIVGSEILAEDLVGDALERAWRTWPNLRDQDRFRPWLTRIVVNACRDELRRRQRVRFVALEDESTRPSRMTDSVDDRDAIARAFDALDADERAVAVLRLDQDLALPEVARRLGIPLGTAKSRLHRAIARMRAELSRNDR